MPVRGRERQSILGARASRPPRVDDANKVKDRLENFEVMPQKQHLKGATPKEQRQYEHIKESAEKTGRYGKRAKEVAARTVMKQHKKTHD